MRIVLPLALAALTACQFDFRESARPPSHDEGSGAWDDPVPPAASGPGTASCDGTIDAQKALLVVDPSVLESAEAKNDVDGAAFSFRTRMTEIAGDDEAAARLTAAWIDSWGTVTKVGADAAPVTPRPAAHDLLVAPWVGPAYGARSMRDAPFRLVAIVNRLDLRDDVAGCHGAGGELRFVYTAVDPRTRRPLDMSSIVEVPYPATRTPRAWADAWLAIALDTNRDSYVARLASLVREVMHDADPARTRVRTNEVAFGAASGLPWELREFVVGRASDGARALVPAPLQTTPRDGLDGSPQLDGWLRSHEDRLASGIADDLPPAMQAGSALLRDPRVRWEARSSPVDESARATFSQATCNGCHGGERPADPLLFRHLAPTGDAQGATTAISTYLSNPGADTDELRRRAASMRALLCGTCDGASGEADGGAPAPPYGLRASCR